MPLQVPLQRSSEFLDDLLASVELARAGSVFGKAKKPDTGSAILDVILSMLSPEDALPVPGGVAGVTFKKFAGPVVRRGKSVFDRLLESFSERSAEGMTTDTFMEHILDSIVASITRSRGIAPFGKGISSIRRRISPAENIIQGSERFRPLDIESTKEILQSLRKQGVLTETFLSKFSREQVPDFIDPDFMIDPNLLSRVLRFIEETAE